MGAFDEARTHDWQVSTDHESNALPTAPGDAASVFKTTYFRSKTHTIYEISTTFVGAEDGFISQMPLYKKARKTIKVKDQ